MADYYVQIRKGGAWHRQDRNLWWTKCGEYPPVVDDGWLLKYQWVAKSTEPQEPLCQRRGCKESKR